PGPEGARLGRPPYQSRGALVRRATAPLLPHHRRRPRDAEPVERHLAPDARLRRSLHRRDRFMSVNAPRSIDGVFMDVRAYTSLFYMLLTLATGIVYGAVGGAVVHRHTVTGGCAAPGPAHRRH